MKEKFEIYKQIARLKDYSNVDTSMLAELTRQSCGKTWKKVPNNTFKTYKGEEIRKIYHSDGTIKETWLYTFDNKFDDILLSNLILRFEVLIISSCRATILSKDDYYDVAIDSMFKALRSYDYESGLEFSTLYVTTLKRLALNKFYQEYTTMSKTKKDDVYLKKVKYNYGTLYLDDVLNESGGSSLIPQETIKYDIVENLRDKYAKEKDLMSWIITDIYSNDSKLLKIPEIIAIQRQKEYKSDLIKKIYLILFQTKLYNILGFGKSEDETYFLKVSKMDIADSKKITKFNTYIRERYVKAKEKIYAELKGGNTLCC